MSALAAGVVAAAAMTVPALLGAHNAGAANPNTGVVQMAVDCDTSTDDVQETCTIDTASTAPIPIDVIITNNSGVGSQVDAFGYDLYNDQCMVGCVNGDTLNPAGGIGPSVPVRDVTNFPLADYGCNAPRPLADRGSGVTGTSTSFLSCALAFVGPPVDFPDGASLRLSGEDFSDSVTGPTTIVLTLSFVSAADDNYITTISCDPAAFPPASPEGNVSGPCFPATLHFTGATGATNTPTLTPTITPTRTITPTPANTLTPTATLTPCATPAHSSCAYARMIQMAIDCDTGTPGVQDACTIDTASTAPIPIDVVVTNKSGENSQIDAFGYDLYNDQCMVGCVQGDTLNPAGGIGPSIPVRDVTNFPVEDYDCAFRALADTGVGITGTSTTYLECIFGFPGTPLDLPAGASVRLSGESFSDSVTGPTTIVLTLSNVAAAADNVFLETISCDADAPPPASPEGIVSGPCFPATLHFTGATGATNTPTPIATPYHHSGTCDLDGATETNFDDDDGRPCEASFWKGGGGRSLAVTLLPITLGIIGSDCDVATKSTKCLPPRKISVDRDVEAHNILEGCGSGDSSVKMTCQLLATKLNLASGSAFYPHGDPACIAAVVTQAEALLSQYGYNTKPAGAAQTLEKSVATKLQYWNKKGFCL